MHTAPDLAAALAAISGSSFEGVLYRAVFLEALYGFHRTPPYPEPRPLFSLGSPRHGARFTPRSGMATLYVAEDVETAYAEANQTAQQSQGSSPETGQEAPPTVIITVTARLGSVLDLLQPAVQQALGTHPDELAGSWRTLQDDGKPVPTQELGSAVFAVGRFQAIRYSSARLPGHGCFAIFTERLTPTDFVEVSDPHDNVRQRIP